MAGPFWSPIRGQFNADYQCARCHQPLHCEACKTHPTHKPYPKQASQMLVDKTVKDDPKRFFKTINKIRNALLHGEAPETIQEELGVTLTDVVDQIGRLARSCIYNEFLAAFRSQKLKGGPLALLQTKIYSHSTLTVASHVTVTTKNADNPRGTDLPDLKLEIFNLGEAWSYASGQPPTKRPESLTTGEHDVPSI